MIAAGIHVASTRLTVCVTNATGATRYLAAALTPAACTSLAASLRHMGIGDVVLAAESPASGFLATILSAASMDVWFTPAPLLADLVHVAGRRGNRTVAAILARVASTTTLQGALRLYAPPTTPPTQLTLC
jgi:hypothetical protein